MFVCHHKSPVLRILLFGYYFFSLACQTYYYVYTNKMHQSSFSEEKKLVKLWPWYGYKEQVDAAIITKYYAPIIVFWTFGLSRTGRQFEFVFDSTMLGVKLFGAIALCGLLAIVDVSQAFKTVCYYDGKALWRKGNFKS